MSDKELINQEIERLLKQNEHHQHNDSIQESLDKASKCRLLYELKKFIDSLPEEPESEDLEEEIENYIKDSLAIKFPTTDKEQIKADIRYIARHFAEWQKQKAMQDFLEKAEKFFNEELYMSVSDQICSLNNFTSMSNFVEYFKNYMKDEM